MTNKQTGTSGLVEVTQADRDAAADYLAAKGDPPLRAINIRNGRGDDGPTVQAFARHRLASLSPVPVDERLRALKEAADEGYAISQDRCHDADTQAHGMWRYQKALQEAGKIAFAALTASRPSDDGEVERLRVVSWLREQSDKGAEVGIKAAKGTTRRAAYGGGSYALSIAADAIERGEHCDNGWRSDVENAPKDGSRVKLRVVYEFEAAWLEGLVNDEGDACGGWQNAVGDIPPCWTDGTCWESNEDGSASASPNYWRLPAALSSLVGEKS